MDGESLKYKLRQILLEADTSTFLDDRTSYDYLFEAAKELQRRTNALTQLEGITSIANVDTYDLPVNFMHLYARDQWNQLVIPYQVSGETRAYSYLKFRDYDTFKQRQMFSTAPVPAFFTIIDNHTQEDRIIGNTTSDGAESLGECALIDSSAPFSNVKVGDSVHNVTDGSSGLVIEVVSDSELTTVLFGGTANEWSSLQDYVVVPQASKSLIVDPIPSNAGDTFQVDYVTLPTPVYSPYRAYRFDSQFEMPMVYYAAWLYKYRDSKPGFGDGWYKQFDIACRRMTSATNKSVNKRSFRVNFTKKPFTYSDRSFR